MTRPRRLLAAGCVAVLAVGLAAGAAWQRLDVWVAATVLPPLVPEVSVEVLALDGTLLRAYQVGDGRWRLALDPARVAPGYLAMLLAYEDRRFHRHRGVDPLALIRAGAQAVARGRVVSGGSTLTMQVARLIEDGPTGQWAGKWRQLRVALALERRLSKADILALYLHHAPFGGNIEGLRAASIAWFGKEPARLTPAEAALMVALPQAPEARRPDRHPERARAARDRVLARMVRAGVLDSESAAAARAEPVPTARRPFPQHAPHLANRLRAADPAARVHRTTIDARVQVGLEALAARAVAGQGAALNVAMILAEHESGEIRASVGSARYTDTARQGFVDMTRAVRSPGSTLKPLVYGLAFADGRLHPESLMQDRPASFGGYAPRNFDGQFRGPVTAREALQLSLNLPVVELTEALGPARLMAGLRAAGVRPEVPGEVPGLAVALGGLGLSLHDLVKLYAAIARGGEAVALSEVPWGRAPGGSGHVTGPHMRTAVDLVSGQKRDAAGREARRKRDAADGAGARVLRTDDGPVVGPVRSGGRDGVEGRGFPREIAGTVHHEAPRGVRADDAGAAGPHAGLASDNPGHMEAHVAPTQSSGAAGDGVSGDAMPGDAMPVDAMPVDAMPGGALAGGALAAASHPRAGAAGAQGTRPGVRTGVSAARVLPPEAAWHLGTILAQAPRPGWLPEGPLAFKTGTSYGHRDVLAVGFDGVHVGAVWMGRADGAPVPGIYGVDRAAPLLFEAFARAAPALAPLPAPPTGVVQVPNAQLPAPLRAFGGARAQAEAAGPVVRFPPDGATVTPLEGQLLVRVERGVAPFTWLADGVPVLTASPEREALLALPGPGFVALSVIDAQGQAARARIELR